METARLKTAEWICTCLCLTVFIDLTAQKVIPLTNPSFENSLLIHKNAGYPDLVIRKPIPGWFDCAMFPGQTPPDPHSATTNQFQVNHEPYDGETYVGMVVRPSGTWECLGTELPLKLKPGNTYALAIYAAQSAAYISEARLDSGRFELTSFTNPVILRLYGVATQKGFPFLIGESQSVDHLEWRPYVFKFRPQEKMKYLLIEANYVSGTTVPYAGHVLIDHVKLVRID